VVRTGSVCVSMWVVRPVSKCVYQCGWSVLEVCVSMWVVRPVSKCAWVCVYMTVWQVECFSIDFRHCLNSSSTFSCSQSTCLIS